MKYIYLLLLSFFGFSQANAVLINGAGASFPAPIYSKWFLEFQKNQQDVRINYQSIGSGAGITQVVSQTVDFGASDSPMKDEELKKSAIPILHIPTVMGAVTVSYNLPDYNGELKLTPETLAAIFLGKITRWDDPQLLKLNPNLAKMEQLHIQTIQRADGSGTTAIFTEYLSKVSPEWKDKVGEGKTVTWPTGMNNKGNEGVSGAIKQGPGSIGYVELTFALANNLRTAILKNASGQFIKADIASVTAAAKDIKISDDMRMSITNSPAKMAYPISAFTYLLIPQQMPKEKGQKIVEFLNWAMTTGQGMTGAMHYAPLPDKVIAKSKASIQKTELNLTDCIPS
jgi:phosphate transport system substrate-binding protein